MHIKNCDIYCQVRPQYYVNRELPDFSMYKLYFGKAENQKSHCQHLLDHRKSKGISEKHYFCFIDYAKAFDSVDHNKLWKILK